MLVAAGRLEFNQTRTNARSSCCRSTLLLLPAPYMAAPLPHELLNDLRTEANSPSPPLEEEWQDRILVHARIGIPRPGGPFPVVDAFVKPASICKSNIPS